MMKSWFSWPNNLGRKVNEVVLGEEASATKKDGSESLINFLIMIGRGF